MTQTIVTHAIALLIGIGSGWFLNSKLGSKVATVEADIKKL